MATVEVSPIYLQAKEVGSQVVLLALSGQTTKSGDSIDPHTPIIPRTDFDHDVIEGAIYGTNVLTLHKSGYYIAGAEFYQITDDAKLLLSDKSFTDKHKAYIAAYSVNTNGFYGNPSTAKPDKKKSKKATLCELLMSSASKKPPTIEDDGFYVDTELWYVLLRFMHRRKNVMLIGDSGCGKTALIRLLAGRMGKEFNKFDMAVKDPRKTFCGGLRMTDGNTHFEYARFAKKIQTDGLILMDEISRADPSANNILIPLLDDDRTMYIEDAPDGGGIKAHADCMFWATANLGSEYVGTQALDHALLNRFQAIAIDFPPKDIESKLLVKRAGVSKYQADQIAKMGELIRKNEELSVNVSTRELLDVAEMVFDGWSVAKSVEFTFLSKFESDETDGGERGVVRNIITSI